MGAHQYPRVSCCKVCAGFLLAGRHPDREKTCIEFGAATSCSSVSKRSSDIQAKVNDHQMMVCFNAKFSISFITYIQKIITKSNPDPDMIDLITCSLSASHNSMA